MANDGPERRREVAGNAVLDQRFPQPRLGKLRISCSATELPRRVPGPLGCGEGEYNKNSLAHQRLDLLAVGAEAEKDALVDEHGGHGEAAGEAEHFLAGLG